MNFNLLSPREQLTKIMHRIYHQGMTTLSGGNLSIMDENGDMWITPARTDKGRLTAQEIVCVKPDGTIEGAHRPSSEYPFHQKIYAQRPDIRSIVHCHSPALVSFSIVHQTPNTKIIPKVFKSCGQVGYAPYALTGTEELGEIIAATYAEGYNTVLLENHGIVTTGEDLLTAFGRLETVDFCARTLLHAGRLGQASTLTDAQLALANVDSPCPTFTPDPPSAQERELRGQIVDMIHRAYKRQLITSTQGAASARLDAQSFLITPENTDRQLLDIADVVLMQNGKCEAGKQPDRLSRMHEAIYKQHPDVNYIMTAQSPYIMAYSVTSIPFDTKPMFESYYLLRDVPVIPYGVQYQEPRQVAEVVSDSAPVVLIQNECLVATGQIILEAFDRLEVAEAGAKILIDTDSIGEFVPLSDEQIQEVNIAFSL